MCHPPRDVPPSPFRVVVAEDDDQLAELITSLLDEDERFTVVARARTGDEAVELAGEHRPDIVVMDLGMPGCDGVEATRVIHSLNADQHVIVYTGSDEYGDVARTEEAGAHGFLHKDALTSSELPDALDVLHRNYLSNVEEEEEADISEWARSAPTQTCPACGAPGAVQLGGGVFCPTCREVTTNPGYTPPAE
jgi:DNA-binding NarL/FixJ family response regulator